MLRLDDDMSEFYDLISSEPEFAWIQQQGAGRLLRSPTLFEDIVKTICTTNCSWSLTTTMVTSLVKNLGVPAGNEQKSFPTPEAMAIMPLEFFKHEIRAGYRAPYLKELAERSASGDLPTEQWLKSDLPTSELKRELKKIKGVGDYAADTLLKLIGRYEYLALDSWVRGKFSRVRNNGRAASDKKIARYYARFKSWRGLVLWCDLTKDWLDDNLKLQ